MQRRDTSSMIDSLEPRQMLATLSGTPGDDLIRVSIAGLRVTVDINGTVQEELGTSVTVRASGGNDTIILDKVLGLHQINIANVYIQGGDGNDLIRLGNTDPANFQTNDAHFNLDLSGGSGEDTLEMDFLGAASSRSFAFEFGNRFEFGSSFPRCSFSYANDWEHFELDGTAFNDGFFIASKHAPLQLAAHGQGGNDSFLVGNGDLIDNQLMNSTTVSGGSGDDSVVFRDASSGAAGNYALDTSTLTRDSNVLTYSTFETITLETDNRIIGGVTTPNTVSLNGNNGSADSTTIRGASTAAPHRDNIVSVGATHLNNVAGVVNVISASSLTINETGQTLGLTSSFEINNLQVVKTSNGQIINYSNVGQITLNARDSTTVRDTILVRSTPAGTNVVVNANAGDDGLTMGNGNLDADLLGGVTINAGEGNDSAGFNNSLDTSPETLTLDGLVLTDGPRTFSFSEAESLSVSLGTGGTNMTVISTVGTTRINGNSGNDDFDVGGGSLDTNIPATTGGAAALIIDGFGGVNSIRFNDTTDTGADRYYFERPNGTDLLIKRVGAIDHITAWFGMSSATLDASNAAVTTGLFSIIQVVDSNTPLRINANGGNDWVDIRDAAFPVYVHTGIGGLDRLEINSDFDAQPVTVMMDQSDDVEQLRIFEAATLRIGEDIVVVKTRNQTPSAGMLTINGTIDLAGALISRTGGAGTPPPTSAFFRQLLTRGHNGGGWNGTNTAGAIHSSLAAGSTLSDGVGYALGSEVGVSNMGGFAIAPGDTLIRHALDGDADLNGAVNLDDFTRVAAAFGTPSSVWVRGDFNYDGLSNLNDFTPLAANFGASVPAARAASHAPIRNPFSSRLIEEVL